ncbi:MAG: HAD-IIIC family phosphatase, partial [Oscillospiraceae bacterium]|nr:HAD-IIIC family phosphatase [Oscillospiraceae bacterium]
MKERTFVQLMKNSRRELDGNKKRVAVMGDCSTQHLATAIRGCAYEENLPLEVLDTDYNQILAQAMDTQSTLYSFNPDCVLIYMCSEHLYEEYCSTPVPQRTGFAAKKMDEIRMVWQLIAANSKMMVYQFNFAENDDRIFGDFALNLEHSYIYQLRKLNFLMMEESAKISGVSLVDLNGIQASIGRKEFYDDKLYYTAKMPLSMKALPLAAGQFVDMLKAAAGKVKKCVVLDLDNTLWGGVIGDDGMNNIQIGELGTGRAFTQFQTWLKELKNRGIVLAVCSKNNDNIAREPFEKHPDMVLRLDDIAMFVANWQDKASNIRNIQQVLNLGMDSFVFVDDNPFERNVVSSLIDNITVPDLPEDPSEYVTYLKSLNLFETASYSSSDMDRTAQYQSEAGRAMLQQSFQDYDQYLESLEMTADAKAFDEFHTARISQLSQRSNQFNLRTVRYSVADIEQISSDDRYTTIYFTLKD